METLIAPCPRISAWLDELKCSAEASSRLNVNLQTLSSWNTLWVQLNTQLISQAVKLIQGQLEQGKATESLYVRGSSLDTPTLHN